MSFNDDNQDVKTSVVDQYAAPDVEDELHSDIPENKQETQSALEEASDYAAYELTGQDDLNQWQAQNSAEAETNAAVANGATQPRPAETIGEDSDPVDQSVAESYREGVKTSVVDQYGATNANDFLHSDIPENKAQASDALKEASDYAAYELTGQDDLNQWQAQNSAEAETNAAVADGATQPRPAETIGEESDPVDQSVAESYHEGVKTSVVDQYAAPNAGDFLHSDIPENKTQENEGLEEATIAADDSLEGDTVNQWQAEGNAESETDAAVADGADRPRPDKTVGEE